MKLTPDIVRALRAQFPGLARSENGKQAVFFDGPAGTQVPECVGNAMTKYLYHCNANHHGQFATSRESDELLHDAHQAHADFVGADSGDEVIFGQNMTSLTFAFSRALCKTWRAGDEIIVSALDHDANITPWVMAAEERDVKVHFIPYHGENLTLDLNAYENLLSERTKLVAVGCASNATGGINDVKKIAEMAHAVGAKVFLDAVHYGPHGLIDVKDWNCDFLVCSDYKFFGPHLGMLWGPRESLESLDAFKVRPASNQLPAKWMTGTQSHEAIAGGMACIDYIASIGQMVNEHSGEEIPSDRRSLLKTAFEAITEYERALSASLIDGLNSIDGINVYGITDRTRLNERFPTFSIRHESVAPAEIAKHLGEQGIFVWNGNYYALEFSQRMGFEPEGMVRIGLVHYNTPEEIERLLSALKQAISVSVS